MPPRPTFASIFLALIAAACLLGAACSKSSPQDMRKGTDAALGWTPPDTTTVTYPDLTPGLDRGGPADSPGSADGGAVVDADIDEGN
jgi:hypothetical protein